MPNQFKAKPKREPSTFQTILAWLALLSIIIGTMALVYYSPQLMPLDSSHKESFLLQVYKEEDQWHQSKINHDTPAMIEISQKGVLWLSCTGTFRGLAAYYPDDEPLFYETESNVRDMTLVDETLWAVTGDEVLHFDGTTWISYSEGVVSKRASSLVANQDEVWVIDDWGNLSHFDGTTWTISDLKESLPESQWSRSFAAFLDNPQLALTTDGKLWFDHNRLWYWDGKQWTETSPPDESSDEIEIVAVTEAGLWVRTNALWLWDGDKWREVMQVLGFNGFPAGQKVISISPLGNLITTNEAIFTRTDSRWQALPPPQGNLFNTKQIAIRPDGTIWAIFSPWPDKRTWWDIVKALVPLLGLFALWDEIARFLFAPSRPSEAEAEGTGALLRPLLLVLMIAGPPLLLLWMIPILSLCIPLGVSYLLLWVVPPVVRRRFIRWQDQPKAGQKSLTRELIERGTLFLSVVVIGGGWDLVGKWVVSHNWPDYIHLPLFVLLLSPILLFCLFAIVWWDKRALNQGDYESALQQIRERKGSRAPHALLLSQSDVPILLLAGRHLEAEQQILKFINKKREAPFFWIRHSPLAELGYAYLGQERYPEAMQAFSEALEEAAITNESYILNGLAEVYLRQGNDPARALDSLDMALEKNPSSFLPRLLKADDMIAQIIANRAWALAQQNRHLEAEEVLEEAFEKVVSNSKPRLAAVHYRAAHVHKLRGNKAAALEHAFAAQELDPHGDAGRLAAQLLLA